jgi:hypothetical protein
MLDPGGWLLLLREREPDGHGGANTYLAFGTDVSSMRIDDISADG